MPPSRVNRSTIEAIHLAVSRVNCFDVRHFVPLFCVVCIGWKCFFFQYKVDFVNQCVIFKKNFVSVNCYVSWLVCVAIYVSRSHSLYKKKCFPLLLLFFSRPNPQRIGPREERGEEESMGPPFSYTPFLPFLWLTKSQ
jgi:hypothetical protein